MTRTIKCQTPRTDIRDVYIIILLFYYKNTYFTFYRPLYILSIFRSVSTLFFSNNKRFIRFLMNIVGMHEGN